MKEKIKIILKNVQMRNIIYLFLGFIFSLVVIMTYKPTRKSPTIIDEDKVKVPQKEEQNNDTRNNNILEQYKNLETFTYRIYYNEYIIDGIYENDSFNDNIEVEEVKEFEQLIKPNNLYELLKDKEYQDNYEYNIDNYKIKIEVQNEKIKRITINQMTIEYGG